MTLFALLLALSSTPAHSSAHICAAFHTTFVDPGGEVWPDNDDYPLRGVFFDTHQSGGGWVSHQFNESGCLLVSGLNTNLATDVRIHSQAEIDQVTITSYTEGEETYDPGDLTLEMEIKTIPPHVLDALVVFYGPLIAEPQTWDNLVVGLAAFHESTFHFGEEYSNRACAALPFNAEECLEPDGTVTPTYECDDTPIYAGWEDDDPMEIVFVNQTWTGECCGDIWPGRCTPSLWSDDTICDSMKPAPHYFEYEAPVQHFPFVRINQRWKFQIAHELGHAVVEKRMPWLTNMGASAPLDDCMGSYWPCSNSSPPWYPSSPAKCSPCDAGGSGDKSELTREYKSMAAREGWASFFSTWLWNTPGNSGCIFNTQILHDFDLDGDVDNNYGDTGIYLGDVDYNGAYDACIPGLVNDEAGEPFPTNDPEDTGIAWGDDWLADMDNAGRCGTTSLYNSYSTQVDWQRFFWDLNVDQDISIEELTDIYVDACPTTWHAGAGYVPVDWTVPERFYDSMWFYDRNWEYDAEKVHGVVHYEP
jgi:hypothetical protein